MLGGLEQVGKCHARGQVAGEGAFENGRTEIDQGEVLVDAASGGAELMGQRFDGEVAIALEQLVPMVGVAEGGDDVVLGFWVGGHEQVLAVGG